MGAKRARRGAGLSGLPIQVASFVLILLPVVLGFLFVRWYGVDVPFGDAWTMVDVFDKYSDGRLGFRDLWVAHYEHRMFFTRSTLLLLGLVTSFDNVAAMYLIQGTLLATLIVLFVAFRESVSTKLLLFVPIPFLVFSLAQWFNLLNVFQLGFPLVEALAVLAFYALHLSLHGRYRAPTFVAALGFGMVASFSFLPGLFVWPAGFLQILVSSMERSRKVVLAGVWGLAGVAAFAAYLYRLEVPERLKSNYFFETPNLVVDYFLAALGTPLSRDPVLALVGGTLLAVLIGVSLVFVYKAGKLSDCSFWIALLSFSLIVLVTQTLGRSGGGLQSALQSRYVTFTGLSIISTYAMLAKLFVERGSFSATGRRVVAVSLGVLAALIVASVPLSYGEGFGVGGDLKATREVEAERLATYDSQPDRALKMLNRGPRLIRTKAFVLCKLEYSVFSERGNEACLPPPIDDLSPIDSPTLSAVETVSGRRARGGSGPISVRPTSGGVEVTGWAVDADAGEAAGGVYVDVDGRRFPAFYGSAEGGVASRLGNPAYQFSGFERSIPVSEIGPGEHELSLIVVSSDGEGYYRPGRPVAFRVGR